MGWACGTRGFGARASSLPCSGTVPRLAACRQAQRQRQGVFVWVIAAGFSKGCGPGAVRGRDRAVGQVDGDSCGQSSLSVWVGEGELAFSARETPQRQDSRRGRDSSSGGAKTPRGRSILRPVKPREGAESLELLQSSSVQRSRRGHPVGAGRSGGSGRLSVALSFLS